MVNKNPPANWLGREHGHKKNAKDRHVEPLVNRLIHASIGACSCITKSPDFTLHDPLCRFRLFSECIEEITKHGDNPPHKYTDYGPKALMRRCPNCGSGDVRWCSISIRPYCADCNTWGSVNFGTADDAVGSWNNAVKNSGFVG